MPSQPLSATMQRLEVKRPRPEFAHPETNVKDCRICHGKRLVRYLDLGFMPPADGFLTAEQLSEPETFYPLQVFLCMDCGLSQLGYVVPREILFQRNYPYESSMTATGRAHFFGLAGSVVDRFGLKGTDLCVDVGSNVGVLLQGFRNRGCRILGVEPAGRIAERAILNGIPTVDTFFDPEVASAIVREHGLASVITATNVFAHVHDLDRLMEAVSILLSKRGIFVIEAPHFLKLVECGEYDTIYHEHLSYLAIRPLSVLFGRLGYEIIDVERIGIHGGSLRNYISRAGRWPITQAAKKVAEEEEGAGLFDLDRLGQFRLWVEAHRMKLRDMLLSIKKEGKRIAGVSAPAKGMTLLNYCQIDGTILDFVTEKSTLKIGRYTPGSRIPILPDSALMERHPGYALLLAWNFAEEIMANLSLYREKGGRFIVPIPEPCFA